MGKTMLVRLSGQVVMNYEGVVEVVGDPPQKAISTLTRAMHSKVDAGKYVPTFHLWEPEPCSVCESTSADSPSFRATWNLGRWEIEEL
jgi:hypothetical protein